MEKGMATTPVFLPQEQYKKAKMTLGDEHPYLGQHVSNMLLGESGEIAPERMRRLGDSRNDPQL